MIPGQSVAAFDDTEHADGLFITMLEGDADLRTAFELKLADERDTPLGEVSADGFAEFFAMCVRLASTT